MSPNNQFHILVAAYHLSVTHSAATDIASTWAALVLKILAILVPVILFIVAERRFGKRLRAEKKERAEEKEQEKDRLARAAERNIWEKEFEEIRGYQLRAEQAADRILAQPNISRSVADDAELEKLERSFQAVSRRCPEMLKPTLLQVSEAIMRLRKINLPTDDDVKYAYYQALTDGGVQSLGSEWQASTLGARTVEHYRAASELREAIHTCWQEYRRSRGEE